MCRDASLGRTGAVVTDRRKTVWILNHYATLGHGRHYKLAYYLARRGHLVTIFAASTVHGTERNLIIGKAPYTLEEDGPVPSILIRARDYSGNGWDRIGNMVDYALRVVSVSKKLRVVKPDVVIASSVHPLTWLSGYIIARRYNAKFIAETRDLWPQTLIDMGRLRENSIVAKVLYWFERFIYTKADKLIFTMPGGKDYVASLGLDTSKVAYINNGVDLEEFHQNKVTHVLPDADLDRTDVFKVVYTGSMGQANALHYVVEAAEILQRRGFSKILFLLYGDGYQKMKLEELARSKGLTNIRFRGRVEKRFVPSILSRSDLNIFTGQHIPLYKYGLSLNKMFEYFATGKPTISNIECGYDLLDKYQCGITVQGGCPEALADGIIKFYNMPPEDYAHFCQQASMAAQDFDFKVLAEKLEQLILE
jgi:glycosyltransferase involved in cell wall biosynthesis